MIGLALLPTEILLEIAKATTGCKEEYRSWDGSLELRDVRILQRQDLLNLTYVSRRFNRTFNQDLYEYDRDYEQGYCFHKSLRTDSTETLNLMRHFGIETHRTKPGKSSIYCLKDACSWRALRAAKWLLDDGALFEKLIKDAPSPYPIARIDRSVLVGALAERQEEMALLLLSYGATPYFSVDPRDGEVRMQTALHWAAKLHLPRVAEALLQKGIPVDQLDYMGETPLSTYIDELACGPCWSDECTAEHENIYGIRRMSNNCEEDVTMLRLFIRHGADVNFVLHGKTILALALSAKYFDHANILLDAGAKANPDLRSMKAFADPISAYLDNRYCGYKGFSAFENGASKSRYILKRLVKCGVDLNARSHRGYTPLEEAVLNASPEVIPMLVEAGASLDPDPKTPGGCNILDFFVKNREWMVGCRFEKAAALVEAGARIDVPLPTTGRSFLEVMIRVYFENPYTPPERLRLLLFAANHSNMRFSHLHKILEHHIRDAVPQWTQKNGLCNAFIDYGVWLKDTDLAFETAKNFIGHIEEPFREDHALCDALIDMVSIDRLGSLFAKARQRKDDISATKILERMTGAQDSRLNLTYNFDWELSEEEALSPTN